LRSEILRPAQGTSQEPSPRGAEKHHTARANLRYGATDALRRSDSHTLLTNRASIGVKSVCPLQLPELSEYQLDCLRRFLRFEFPIEIYHESGLRSHYFREYPDLPNPGLLGPLFPAFHGFRLTAPPAGVVCCCAPSRTYLLDGLNRHLDWVSPGTLHPGPKRPICGGGKVIGTPGRGTQDHSAV
jgi:hypothetical protein